MRVTSANARVYLFICGAPCYLLHAARNMAITIIIVLLVVASTTGARSLDNGRLEDRSAEAGLPPILVNFTVQRLGKDIIDANQLEQDLFFTFFYNGFNDSFCREGVDTPGNITLYTFYRCRVDNDTISDWMFLQKDSMSIGLPYVISSKCLIHYLVLYRVQYRL